MTNAPAPHPPATGPGAWAAQPRLAHRPARTTVAIVEDDANYRSTLAHAVLCSSRLALLGAAHSVATAKALLQRHAPEVLLVDLGLPDGSGLEVIRHAAAACPDCEVMVLSGVADPAQVLAAIAAGANGYLLKEVSDAELVDHIDTLRRGGSPISPQLARQLLVRLQAGRAGPRDDLSGPPLLSTQERLVLQEVSRGGTVDEIAAGLGISRWTVQTYVKRTYRKLQAHSRNEAVYEARRLGLLREPESPRPPSRP